MKSLVESLFDTEKNITKDITFGDLYGVYRDSRYWKSSPLDKIFSAQRVKSKSGVKGTDKKEIVHDGILQIILNIKLEKSPDDKDFIAYMENRIYSETYNLFMSSFPQQYRYPRIASIMGNDTAISVNFRGGLSYTFDKK